MQLAYLPDRTREYMINDDVGSLDSELSEGISDASNLDDPVKGDKRNRRRGMLGWFKLRVSFFLFPFGIRYANDTVHFINYCLYEIYDTLFLINFETVDVL